MAFKLKDLKGLSKHRFKVDFKMLLESSGKVLDGKVINLTLLQFPTLKQPELGENMFPVMGGKGKMIDGNKIVHDSNIINDLDKEVIKNPLSPFSDLISE